MTIFGPDISSYQHGVNVGALSDPFVLAKATEGTYYTDADYPGWRQQAAAAGKVFVWYHFLSSEDAVLQVDHTVANIGDSSLPGMLDFEPAGSFRPTLAQALNYIDAAHAAGLKLKLVYFPRWYWQQIGSPDLSPLTDRGVALVSSAYPGGSGYPGDNAAGWQPYGGKTPLLYQYTDVAVEGGQTVGDMNAYRGSRDQLATDLGVSTLTPSPASTEDDNMPAFATGQIAPGAGAVTIVCPPPANTGAIWGSVWFSLGSDFGDAHVRVAAWIHNNGWTVVNDVTVPSAGDRVNPWNGPAPAGIQKISIRRISGTENVPLSWLIEAAHR